MGNAQRLWNAYQDMKRTARLQFIWEFERYQAINGNSEYTEDECLEMVLALRKEGWDLRTIIGKLRKKRKKVA